MRLCIEPSIKKRSQQRSFLKQRCSLFLIDSIHRIKLFPSSTACAGLGLSNSASRYCFAITTLRNSASGFAFGLLTEFQRLRPTISLSGYGRV